MDAATARHDVNAISATARSDAGSIPFPRFVAQRLNGEVRVLLARSERRSIGPTARIHGSDGRATPHGARSQNDGAGRGRDGYFRAMVEMRDGRPLITLVRATTIFDVPEGMDSLAKQKGRGLDARR
jgi:hypothetical protein